MKKALILTDGKAGHENQSRAFARRLGLDCDVVAVSFRSRVHKALSYALDRIGVRTLRLFAPLPPFPSPSPYAVAIGTGSGTFYAAKSVARRLKIPCGVVLYPRGYDLASFGCILAPTFDRPKAAGNVIGIPANLVAADASFYDEGVARFLEHYARTTGRAFAPGTPAVAVIVGGPNKCATLPADWMAAQLDAIFADPANKGAEFHVTTSRRTPPDVEAVVARYPWHYRLLYSQDHFNPIPAFVATAKRLYVTAESTGMISEACTSGSAEVRVLDNLLPGQHKFRRFVEGLRAGGYVDGTKKIDLALPFQTARRILRLEP